MTPEHIIVFAILAIGVIFVLYIAVSATGILCLLRGHRWMYGTSLDETVHGRECMRCGKNQRWWSQWFLHRCPSVGDDRPDDMKAAGRWRSETR